MLWALDLLQRQGKFWPLGCTGARLFVWIIMLDGYLSTTFLKPCFVLLLLLLTHFQGVDDPFS